MIREASYVALVLAASLVAALAISSIPQLGVVHADPVASVQTFAQAAPPLSQAESAPVDDVRSLLRNGAISRRIH